MRASARLFWLPLLLGAFVISSCSFGDDPKLERDEAEPRLEKVVEQTLDELELDASDVIEGAEHCGLPTEAERSIYHGLIRVSDAAVAESTIVRVSEFWDASADAWSSTGEFEVTSDAAASTLNIDGIEVYLAVTSDRAVLQLKGSTECYEP